MTKIFKNDRPEHKAFPDGRHKNDEQPMEGDIPAEQEASLLNLRTLIIATTGLVVMILLVHGLAAVPYLLWAGSDPEETRQPPPGPNLQIAPREELQIYLATQQASLNEYRWINREAGTAGIPIDRAMELLAERGLSVSTPPPDPIWITGEDESGFGQEQITPIPGAQDTP